MPRTSQKIAEANQWRRATTAPSKASASSDKPGPPKAGGIKAGWPLEGGGPGSPLGAKTRLQQCISASPTPATQPDKKEKETSGHTHRPRKRIRTSVSAQVISGVLGVTVAQPTAVEETRLCPTTTKLPPPNDHVNSSKC